MPIKFTILKKVSKSPHAVLQAIPSDYLYLLFVCHAGYMRGSWNFNTFPRVTTFSGADLGKKFKVLAGTGRIAIKLEDVCYVFWPILTAVTKYYEI